ncbi:interferon gamma receptor 1 [Megalops cyprinoides]|uniref:interferon gamma receptor 1 n=1 Tax=Megalops cyprinoides TaxID=118141 RepID=UPI001864E46D|nr:interferon gamma receptor 1 [Megalops cyprinoides]
MKDSLLTSTLTLLIILENGLTLVPAPFNVMVTCHNFETMVYWKYNEVSQFLLFKVELIKDVFKEESEMKNTRLPYVNISSSIRIFERYYVKVTAVNGSEESETAESPTFSFDKSIPVSILCFLDFPDINLSVKGGLMTVNFTHPFHVYRNTPALKQLSPSTVFRYKVLLNETSETLYECAENQRDCSITLPVPKKKLHCINVTGILRSTVVRTSKEICQQEEPQSSMLYFAIPFVVASTLAASVGIVTLVIVFLKKTRSTSSLPNFLAPGKFSSLHPEQTMMTQVLDMQISSTPLLQVLDDASLEEFPTVTALPQEGSRFRIGQEHMEEWGNSWWPARPASLREPCRDQPSERELKDKKQGEDSGDSQLCVTGSSGYDRPQMLLEVELVPDDHVEGYRHS